MIIRKINTLTENAVSEKTALKGKLDRLEIDDKTYTHEYKLLIDRYTAGVERILSTGYRFIYE